MSRKKRMRKSSGEMVPLDPRAVTGPPGPSSAEAPNQIDLDPANFYSPFQPIAPFGPPAITEPREWDYPVGFNINTLPEQLRAFAVLEAMGQSWGLLRTIIEARKDELLRIPWSVQHVDSDKTDKYTEEVGAFLHKPDGKHRFQSWARMLLEDNFVLDAASVYLTRSRTGKPLVAEIVAGRTIRPLIDDTGRIPDYPNPAYQQIIKGFPEVNLTERDLIYAPMRPRPQLPIFGYSPVEMITIEVMQGIRRAAYQLEFWREGSVPDLMVTVPEGWTPTQIALYQAAFDQLMGGNSKVKSKVRFVPGGLKPFEMKGAAGELLKNEYDEWLARLVCFAFGMSPQPFIRMMNRSTSETAQQAAASQGLYPLMSWFKSEVMDPLIQEHFGYDDIEFAWSQDRNTDPKEQADTLSIYVKSGIMTVNEARDSLGLPPKPEGEELLVMTGSGPVPLSSAGAAAALPAQAQATTPGAQPSSEAAAGDDSAQAGKAAIIPFGKGAKKKSRAGWRGY